MSIQVSSRNVAGEIAADFLDALAVSDADRIANLWTEDAVLEFPFAPEGFPFRVEGQPAIEKYFRDALAAVTPIAYPDRVITPLAEPDACVIEFGSQLTVGDDPTVFENKYITIVRVKEGKIAYFKEHYDSLKRVEGFPSGDEMAGESPDPPHTVVVRLRAQPQAGDDLAHLLAEVSVKAVKDPGCQFYRVMRSHDDSRNFVIFEAWDKQTDFENHLAQAWVAEVSARMEPLLEGELAPGTYSEL